MERLKVSSSFEQFSKDFNLEEQMTKLIKRPSKGNNEKADLSFVYKKGSSTCIKIAKDIADKIGITEYVGISYFSEEKMIVISNKFSTSGILYPVSYNKSDKKFRCYRTELFKELVDNIGLSFENRTCISYQNAEVNEHPNLGVIAQIYINEN